jgi:hypothetical protein
VSVFLCRVPRLGGFTGLTVLPGLRDFLVGEGVLLLFAVWAVLVVGLECGTLALPCVFAAGALAPVVPGADAGFGATNTEANCTLCAWEAFVRTSVSAVRGAEWAPIRQHKQQARSMRGTPIHV